MASSPLGRALGAGSDNRHVAAFRSFLPELRPGWWVFRGYLAAWLVSLVLGEYPGVVPTIGRSAVLGLLLTAVAIWASVRLGRHWMARPPRHGWVVLSVAAAVVAVLAFVFTGWGLGRGPHPSYSEPAYGGVGGQVNNIYAFDSDGRPLSGVQLFDQDGNPIDVTTPVFGGDGNEVPMRTRLNAAGAPVHNVFPREPADRIPPALPFAPPRLAPLASPAPSASPSVAPSAAASPSPSAVPSPR